MTQSLVVTGRVEADSMVHLRTLFPSSLPVLLPYAPCTVHVICVQVLVAPKQVQVRARCWVYSCSRRCMNAYYLRSIRDTWALNTHRQDALAAAWTGHILRTSQMLARGQYSLSSNVNKLALRSILIHLDKAADQWLFEDVTIRAFAHHGRG